MKRYTSLYDGGMEPWHEGEWVKHSDHEAALAEAVAQAVRRCVEWIDAWSVHGDRVDNMKNSIKQEFPEAFK